MDGFPDVQASFAALHEAMAETTRQQEALRLEQQQLREQERPSSARASRPRSRISMSEADMRSAATADVDRPTASSLGKLRRSMTGPFLQHQMCWQLQHA